MSMAVHEIDLNYLGVPGAIAAWAVEGPEGWVLIEAGPERNWPELVRGLESLGVSPGDLSALLLTHIHLDHAGGAWRLAELGVPIHVHERGAHHLVDPTKLLASATRIYGDDMDRLWGQLKACPAHTVHAVKDGDVIETAGLRFTAVETTGHASHHIAWSLEESSPATVFTGDAAAMLLPGTKWISLPMPPPELDPEAWQNSIDRLDGGHWTRLCLTHGGTVEAGDLPHHLENLRIALQDHLSCIQRLLADEPDEASRMRLYREWLLESAQESGIEEALFDQYVSKGLLSMNLSGVARFKAQKDHPAKKR
ncbi:MAG: MBL fold metallo-hydrolase [Phycisphaerales bacterium]|nr:MBL fold metallo-hydrolase [Phycisphaerales bacterium]